MKGRACDMCRGTDVQHTCEQGECYWQYLQEREAFERQRQEDEMRDYERRVEDGEL